MAHGKGAFAVLAQIAHGKGVWTAMSLPCLCLCRAPVALFAVHEVFAVCFLNFFAVRYTLPCVLVFFAVRHLFAVHFGFVGRQRNICRALGTRQRTAARQRRFFM